MLCRLRLAILTKKGVRVEVSSSCAQTKSGALTSTIDDNTDRSNSSVVSSLELNTNVIYGLQY